MTRRAWHVEHGDGRRWTNRELSKLYQSTSAWFALNVSGSLGVFYKIGNRLYCDWTTPSARSLDMEVVWDD